MTVSSTTSRISYTGNGTTDAFSVPFRFLANSDLKVYVDDELQVITTDYTVTGAGEQSGGTVTFVAAPANATTIVIYRDPPITQLVDYQSNDRFPAETHEQALDKLTMIAQRHADQLDRAIVFDEDYAGGASPILPEPGAGEFIRWNVAGTALETVSASPSDDTFTQSGTGAVARSWASKVGDIVSVKDFGATGDGVTNDTAAVQAALNVGGAIFFPEGTYLCTSLTIANNVMLYGCGKDSVLKQAASQTADLIYSDTESISVVLRDMVFDGNQANQGTRPTQGTVVFEGPAGGTRSAPRQLIAHNCWFINACLRDIKFEADDDHDGNETLIVDGCWFLGGALADPPNTYSPRFIDSINTVETVITNSYFDTLLTTAPAYGKSGVQHWYGISPKPATSFVRTIVSGNVFKHVGTSSSVSGSGTLGVIDIYDGGGESIIANNRVLNPYGRGISIKADSRNTIIESNVVQDLTGGTGDGTVGASITVNASTTTTSYSGVVIANNIVRNSDDVGIFVNGVTQDAANDLDNILISGNYIYNCTNEGIDVNSANNVVIIGNIIKTCGSGIIFDDCNEILDVKQNTIEDITLNAVLLGSGCQTASLAVIGNTMRTIGSDAVDVGADGCDIATFQGNIFEDVTGNIFDLEDIPTACFIDGNHSINTTGAIMVYGTGVDSITVTPSNRFDKALPSSSIERTIASGAIRIWAPYHTVDTESDAATDDLATINGGVSPGQMIVLTAASSARTVVCKDGTGNLKLAGDFSMDNADDSITLIWDGTNWVEVSRSDNGA